MRLRKLKIEDAPLMLEWMHDESVVKDLQTDFAGKTIDDCRKFIEASIAETEALTACFVLPEAPSPGGTVFDGTKSLNLAIADETDEYMGTVSLKHIYANTAEVGKDLGQRPTRTTEASPASMPVVAEFGIAIRKKAMGKGLAASAMKEIINLGREKFSIEVLYWCVDKKNTRALRFYDKNNYRRADIQKNGIAEVIRELGTYPEEKIDGYVWYAAGSKAFPDFFGIKR